MPRAATSRWQGMMSGMGLAPAAPPTARGETARREIKEETNLDVRMDTAFRHEISYSPASGILKQVVFFAAEAVSREMKNQECEVSGLEWLPQDEAIRAVTYDTDKEVLSHAAEYLGREHGGKQE